MLQLIALAVLLTAQPTQEVARPNFSGDWVVTGPSELAALPNQGQSVVQTGTDLTVRGIGQSGQGLTYKLDGTPTKRVTNGVESTSVISWKAEQMTITTTSNFPGRDPVIATQVWSLKQGELTIDASTNTGQAMTMTFAKKK